MKKGPPSPAGLKEVILPRLLGRDDARLGRGGLIFAQRAHGPHRHIVSGRRRFYAGWFGRRLVVSTHRLGRGAEQQIGRAQWFRQPARVLKQALGFLGHLGLLEMVNQLRGALALRLADGFEDTALGDAAEIVIDRRPPANLRNVEITARAGRSA